MHIDSILPAEFKIICVQVEINEKLKREREIEEIKKLEEEEEMNNNKSA